MSSFAPPHEFHEPSLRLSCASHQLLRTDMTLMTSRLCSTQVPLPPTYHNHLFRTIASPHSNSPPPSMLTMLMTLSTLRLSPIELNLAVAYKAIPPLSGSSSLTLEAKK